MGRYKVKQDAAPVMKAYDQYRRQSVALVTGNDPEHIIIALVEVLNEMDRRLERLEDRMDGNDPDTRP